MIYIDIDDLELLLDANWLADVRDVRKKLLEAADAPARAKIIKSNERLWRDLKSKLSSLGYSKCWYCETQDIRSDNAVDHYRPKMQVAEDSAHPGYWWLAFDYRNFRFACTFCNSRRTGQGGTVGGKQDHFPIADGSPRASDANTSIAIEVPLLLDPCNAADVALVWFDELGQVQVNPKGLYFDAHATDKIAQSRLFYHLDHIALVEARRFVYAETLRLCDQADSAFKQMASNAEGGRDRWVEAMGRLAKRLKRSSEYSAVAICAIRSYRTVSPSAEIVFERLA